MAQSSGMAFERRLIIAWPLIRSRLHADSQLLADGMNDDEHHMRCALQRTQVPTVAAQQQGLAIENTARKQSVRIVVAGASICAGLIPQNCRAYVEKSPSSITRPSSIVGSPTISCGDSSRSK